MTSALATSRLGERVTLLNDRPIRPDAAYVLYWAQMNRRVESNHALQFAASLANERKLPLLYYEGLTCWYPHASDRLHTFVLEGVPETERRLRELGIGYVFHLRRRRSDPDDIVYRLAHQAASVVTDDYPGFIARWHNERVPSKIAVAYFAVDSSCIVPMACFDKREYAAYTIRPKIKKLLPAHFQPVSPVRVRRKYEAPVPEFHTPVTDSGIADLVRQCEINHSVGPSPEFRGGAAEARKRLTRFLRAKMSRYATERNDPTAESTSGLSAYLHFGQISSLQVGLMAQAYAAKHKLMAGEFLEELIVRRELAYNFARFTRNPESFDNLPDWARDTLAKHARDRRDPIYGPDEFEPARTHDPLWNAAQMELLLFGKIHGYYRMYWGKKILEWSESPQEALATMIYLNDRYALDGRDPNGYANILWCLGLHDRPWPERPIFGTVRYMSYEGMRRKTDVDAYIRRIEAAR
ncbi:MAG TPA: deoxyribodipyrimidine photo-lyase [Bryobacteraceae bacterium]